MCDVVFDGPLDVLRDGMWLGQMCPSRMKTVLVSRVFQNDGSAVGRGVAILALADNCDLAVRSLNARTHSQGRYAIRSLEIVRVGAFGCNFGRLANYGDWWLGRLESTGDLGLVLGQGYR